MANSWRSFSQDKMSFSLVLPSTRIRVKSFLNRFKSREKRRGKKVEKLTARDLQNTNLFVERVQPQIHRTRQRQRNPEIVFKHYLINLSLEVPSSNKTKAGPRQASQILPKHCQCIYIRHCQDILLRHCQCTLPRHCQGTLLTDYQGTLPKHCQAILESHCHGTLKRHRQGTLLRHCHN